MKKELVQSALAVKIREVQLELCAKTAPIKEQLHNRSTWPVQKVEILLDGLRHLPILPEILTYASNLFPSFNVEVGYALDKFSPTDLTDQKSRDYISRVAEICHKHKNFERLVIHLVGGSIVLDKDKGYRLSSMNLPEKQEVLATCKQFLNRLDPDGKFMALENTYPVDSNNLGIVVYPCGKVSEDFIGLPRVIDTAHLGITAITYSEVAEEGPNPAYGIYHLSEGEVPVYLGTQNSQEREFGRLAKTRGATEAALSQLLYNPANVVEIHLCGNYNSDRRQKDGAGFEDNSAIDLHKIFGAICAETKFPKKLTVIPEIKEPDGNYTEAPRQRKMFEELKQLL